MGTTLTKGTLFPPVLVDEMINLVRGKSSLAKFCGATPVPFNGETIFTFSFDNEVSIVAENAAKSNGGGTIGSKTVNPIKIEYGMRVSDEFRFAAEEARLQYLRTFAEGMAAKVARGLDIMAMHGLDPRSRTAATATIGTNHFDSLVTQTVTFSAAAPEDNIAAAIGLVEGNEHEVTGLAMAPALKSALAGLKKGSTSNELMFPELAWGANPGVINGLPVDSNSTISFNSGADRGIVGNFRDFFRWGYSRQLPIEVIEYGNPDNSEAGDLKGHNQVYLRGEAYIGWTILDPTAFARIIATT